jgi:hypothetical protein
MIEALISSRTRIKLLMKFFLNSSTTAYLRSLEGEFGDSTNAIRLELNKMEEAGMLTSFLDGNKKLYRANISYPLFDEIHQILRKTIGLDTVVHTVVGRLGNLEKVFLVGDFARGLDSPIIDLVFVGDVQKTYLLELVEKAERMVQRKIRYIIYSEPEFANNTGPLDDAGHSLLLWSK